MDHLMTEAVAGLIVPLIGAVVAFFKSFKFVQEGERGVKLRFGKALRNREGRPRIIEPGFVLLIPWVDSLKRHHVRQQTIELGNQRIMLKDGFVFNVNAMLVFHISDVYCALFEILNLEAALKDLAAGALRDELTARNHDQVANTREIAAKIFDELKTQAEKWGAAISIFKLLDCAPTPEAANIINVSVAARLRTEALIAAAQSLSNGELKGLAPSIAASLIGIPVAANVGETIGNSGSLSRTMSHMKDAIEVQS